MKTIITSLIITFLFCPPALAQPYWAGNDQTPFTQNQNRPNKGEFKSLRAQIRKEVQDFRHTQKQKRKTFFQTLKGRSPEERYSAVKQYCQEQYNIRVTFHQDLYQNFYSKASNLLNSYKNLPPERKQKILANIENKHHEHVAKHEQIYQKNQAFLDSVWNDTSLSPEEKRKALRAYFQSQAQELKAQRKSGRQARKKNFQERRKNYRDQNQDA